jgi:hypothetical protein
MFRVMSSLKGSIKLLRSCTIFSALLLSDAFVSFVLATSSKVTLPLESRRSFVVFRQLLPASFAAVIAAWFGLGGSLLSKIFFASSKSGPRCLYEPGFGHGILTWVREPYEKHDVHCLRMCLHVCCERPASYALPRTQFSKNVMENNVRILMPWDHTAKNLALFQPS